MATTTNWTIHSGGLSDLAGLEPIWVAVHHRHQQSMPELAPYVSDEQTWSARRELYEQLLGKPSTILLLATTEDTVIGYGLAHVIPAAETWLADTWVTGPTIGEIESLAVLPQFRGAGIGTALLVGLETALDDQGVNDRILGVLPGNLDAIRLYQRRGYQPTWLYLSQLPNRSAGNAPNKS
jgi:ribosomal protein S18 acetylase RimI-like enzyme